MNENEMKQNVQSDPFQNKAYKTEHVLEELEENHPKAGSDPAAAATAPNGGVPAATAPNDGVPAATAPADGVPAAAKTAGEAGEDSAPAAHSRKKTAKSKTPKKSWKQREILSSAEEPGYIRRSPARSWFNTFMIMNIPIIGWLYLLILAFGKKDQRKDFAKAYLIYKLVFLLVALAIIAVLLHFGMEAADQLLQYMDML